MRRLVSLFLLVPLLAAAGCVTRQAGVAAPAPASPNEVSPAPTSPAPAVDTELYVAVLRRYLGTPGENSFGQPPHPIYVLDRTDPRAADPMRGTGPGTGGQIGAAEQRRIVAALNGLADIRFVGSPDEVVVRDGCPHVRDGGMLIVLGTPTGGPDRVEVGINGFVACLGATWLTYVVERDGGGWRVSGTTGSAAIA
jgi:hypothetical protein